MAVQASLDAAVVSDDTIMTTLGGMAYAQRTQRYTSANYLYAATMVERGGRVAVLMPARTVAPR
jgi:hypothetical protein